MNNKNNKIELPSTQKGFASMYFWSAVWILILASAGWWALNYINGIYAETGVNSFSRLYGDDEVKALFLYVGLGVISIVAGFIVVMCVGAFYVARSRNILYKNKGGYWHKIEEENYQFPFGKEVKQAAFDRIIEIEVQQTGIGRLVNTGDLHLKMVTFMSGETDEWYWTIPAVENPNERKKEIEAGMLDHEGLKISLAKQKK